MEGVAKFKKIGGCWSHRRSLADKFLYVTLVLVNTYQCAKFQLSSSISFEDMEGVPEYKLGAADLPRPGP